MDQVKIGKFIAQMRKEQNLTQRGLADKLSISDKTVSKWERGRGLPEVSLMLPLCGALGITVNDLLTGQRVAEADYQTRAEENMMNLLRENAENKKRMALSVICGCVTVIGRLRPGGSSLVPRGGGWMARGTAGAGTSHGGSGHRRGGHAGGKRRVLPVPQLPGAVRAHHGRLCKRLPHPDKAAAEVPPLREGIHVQAPDHPVK